jgi:GxxExxY protein
MFVLFIYRNKMQGTTLRRDDLVLPDLSYKIVGVLLNVYGQLGYGLYEKTYQRAVAVSLGQESLKFVEQLYVPIIFEGKVVGKNYLDFLVEDKVAIELKRGDKFVKAHIDQLYNYLVANYLELGILVYFGPQRLHYKRIVNLKPSQG